MALFLLYFGNTIADTEVHGLELIIVFHIFYGKEEQASLSSRPVFGKEEETM